jgi:hypothetical protein
MNSYQDLLDGVLAPPNLFLVLNVQVKSVLTQTCRHVGINNAGARDEGREGSREAGRKPSGGGGGREGVLEGCLKGRGQQEGRHNVA